MWSTGFPGSGHVGSVLFSATCIRDLILSKRVNAAPVRLLISLSIQAQLMNETPSYKKRPEPRVTVDTWFSVCRALLSQQHFADHVPPFGGSWMEDVQ